MNSLQFLKAALLDLAQECTDQDALVVGGGFGLFLRQEHLRESAARTLFTQLPEPRATNDIDLFVRMVVLVDLPKIVALQRRIEQLGFVPIPGAEYFQWKRTDANGKQVKIDLLCGPIEGFGDQLHTEKLPRVRPKAPKKTLRFHARLTEEAIELDTQTIPLLLQGHCTDGRACTCTVRLPHPFTYLMMKLFAFADRKDDVAKDGGRHHAMDLYRTVAMMTETEYAEALRLGRTHCDDARVAHARQVIAGDFTDATSQGMLRLREHQLFRPDFPLQDFGAVLREVFLLPAG